MSGAAGLPAFPTASLFGVRFHIFTVEDLLDGILAGCAGPGDMVIEYVNVRALNLAYELPWFRDFLNASQLAFCDGIGVVLGARMMGVRMGLRHRMTCPDYLDALAGRLAREGRSLFLLAGRPGIAEKAAAMLSCRHPGLRLGHHHGYFRKEGEENEAVLRQLADFRPDMLYVGFGMPVQERWIIDNRARLNAKVIMPLGACLDFYTGELYRGPRWMTDFGLEWLGRLLTESPKRVWGRYLIGNPLFLARVLKERLTGSAP